ncbi:antitoxin Xre/MbcA/ParS toxin-binding domain-containing protein [Roseomonas sp. WA12]
MSEATLGSILGILSKAPLLPMSLSNEVQRGLPLSALERVVQALSPGDVAFTFRVIPRATLARRKKAKPGSRTATPVRLSSDEGARVARLAAIWTLALDVWKTEEAARHFLFKPHPLLDGKPPIDVVLANEFGRPPVEDILGRLKYGSAA